MTVEDFQLERHCQAMAIVSRGPLTAEHVIDAEVLAIEDDIAIGICLAVEQDKEMTFRCQIQFLPHSTELANHPRWMRG